MFWLNVFDCDFVFYIFVEFMYFNFVKCLNIDVEFFLIFILIKGYEV